MTPNFLLLLLPLVGIVLLVDVAHGTLIESARCGKFYCPDTCKITYYNGCAHNCNCGGLVRCPPVRCPAPSPICDIHTLLDGCQTCACRLPFAIVQKTPENSTEESFVFLSISSFEEQMKEREERQGERVVEAFTCTLTMMDKIDECMHGAMAFESSMVRNRTDDRRLDRTLNPMMRPSVEQMSGMCTQLNKAQRCMGETTFKECRNSHIHLAHLDAVYGYPCGPKQRLFAHHMPCIQRAYERDFRMFACEDAATRSLSYIVKSKQDVEYRQKQKCDAMTWLMGCEKPSIGRHCSAEAAQMHEESMGAVTAYMAPECELDRQHMTFKPIKSSKGGATRKRNIEEPTSSSELSSKEALDCSAEEQAEVDVHFGALFKEVKRTETKASLAYPLAFWYGDRQLQRTCDAYGKALKAIKSRTKRDCIDKYEVYSQVFYTLHYPCGYATRDFFAAHFSCLKEVRRTKPVRQCEFAAHQRLEDPSNDVCETYDIMTDCMYDSVVARCGHDAMEMEFQHLALEVRRQVPKCRLRRLFRFVEQ